MTDDDAALAVQWVADYSSRLSCACRAGWSKCERCRLHDWLSRNRKFASEYVFELIEAYERGAFAATPRPVAPGTTGFDSPCRHRDA